MSATDVRISVSEQARLDSCSLEPIRTPGAVQQHGAVIIVDALSYEILYVSANCSALLELEPDWLLGRALGEVIGRGPLELFSDVLDERTTTANPALVAINDRPFDAILHRTGSLVIIDLEPSLIETEAQSTSTLYAAIHRLARIKTAPELWMQATREIRRITHFDHVMVYHFHDDGHGEIVGEDLADGMEPYFGLHYPASDIPPQARDLYLLKLSWVIATSADHPVALLSAIGSDGAALVDLSLSELRSVSPHHLQFMRNMGQASTMSFSLIDNNKLIGMITCAHRTPRRVPFVVRQGLEILANHVALQLSSIASTARFTRRIDMRGVRTALVAELTDDVDISRTLLEGRVTIMDLVPADGAAIRIGGATASIGRTPTAEQLAALTDTLSSRPGGLAFISDALLLDDLDLASLVPSVAGLLIVPLGGEGDYISWFRDELVHSVQWLGDQSAANRQTPLSPRNSFSAWSQDVTGTASGWDGVEIEGVALGHDLESTLFRRAESRLAHVALHDPLTGLPNRRLLMDRLDHALTKYARGEEVAMLFIDLDGFKNVNDALGHEAGDLVLQRTAEVLLSTARAQDTVSRIGGDEFVVLCENTTAEEAETLANRILAAVRNEEDLHPAGAAPIRASIGITSANLSFDAADLLRLADAAMYQAKKAGGNRHSR
jgi:chemotaxis family two-component system sensor kinase Cph1